MNVDPLEIEDTSDWRGYPYELAQSRIPSSATYLHKPWSMDELVMAVALLL